MRDATAELKALAEQGIHLDAATEKAYREVIDAENAVKPAVRLVPQLVPKRSTHR